MAMAVHSTSTLYLILCLSSTILLLSSSHAQAESRDLKYCDKNVNCLWCDLTQFPDVGEKGSKDKNVNYAVKVNEVEILPDPVVRGEPFTFKIAAYTDKPILGGDLIYEISYAGIEGPPATFHHALSEEAPIPVPAGNFTLTHTELLPPVTPPGTYNVKLTFKDQNDKLLTCIIFPFKIGASVSAI